MVARTKPTPDPYYRCELHCNHDLGRGMSVAELIGSKVYRPTVTPVLSRTARRPDPRLDGLAAPTASGAGLGS